MGPRAPFAVRSTPTESPGEVEDGTAISDDSDHEAVVAPESRMTPSEIYRRLVAHGCDDLESLIDPNKYSECMVAEGGFGDIWKGQMRDGTCVAVKVLRFALVKEGGRKGLKRIMREIYNWSKLDHKNVHKLLGVTMFQGRLGMVSHWMPNGNLRDYLDKNRKSNRFELCKQIATGAEYIHRGGMVHGDLKASNILVSDNGVVELTDFDYSLISDCSMLFTDTTRPGGGTLRWMAPELVVETSQPRSKRSDIYALAMTFLEVFTGAPPYYPQCNNDAQVMFKVANKKIPRRPLAFYLRDPRMVEMWRLLRRCWEYDPTARPTAQEVLESTLSLSKCPERKGVSSEMSELSSCASSIASSSASFTQGLPGAGGGGAGLRRVNSADSPRPSQANTNED